MPRSCHRKCQQHNADLEFQLRERQDEQASMNCHCCIVLECQDCDLPIAETFERGRYLMSDLNDLGIED